MRFNRGLCGMKRGLALFLAVGALLWAGPALAEGLDKSDPESYRDLSRGEAWDLRYGEGEEPGDYMGTWTVANCEGGVTLREAPDGHAEAIATVPKWADVEAYYCDPDWFECEYDGQRGYILRQFLTDRPGKYPDYPGNSQ